MGNVAKLPPLEDGYAGLYGQERLNGSAVSSQCFRNGGGGAVCVVGRSGKAVTVSAVNLPAAAVVGTHTSAVSVGQHLRFCFGFYIDRLLIHT